MKCPKCKKKIDKDSIFCVYCGQKFTNKKGGKLHSIDKDLDIDKDKKIKDDIKCNLCKKKIPDDSKFCPFCGGKIIIKCSKCGAPLIEEASFCNQCGKEI